MTVFVPLKTVSEMNAREHWSVRFRRKKEQQKAVKYALIFAGVPVVMDGPVSITLQRIGGRRMDKDNLASSMKHVQDAVAKHLHMDDGDERIAWEYRQKPGGGTRGVSIEFDEKG